jgi:hypothetical protein
MVVSHYGGKPFKSFKRGNKRGNVCSRLSFFFFLYFFFYYKGKFEPIPSPEDGPFAMSHKMCFAIIAFLFGEKKNFLAFLYMLICFFCGGGNPFTKAYFSPTTYWPNLLLL